MLKKRLGIPLLVAIGLLLVAGAVYAELKETGVVYVWDAPAGQYESGNGRYPFDGTWDSVIHVIGYNTISYTVPFSYYTGIGAGSCYTDNNQSAYAGYIEMGLAFQDKTADLKQAFQESRRWELIDCDRANDGGSTFENADKYADPQQYRETIRCAVGFGCQSEYTGTQTFIEARPGLWLERQDVVQDCGNNACDTQITTYLFANLDTNCDGVQDITGIGGVCFYAEGRTPPPTTPPGSPIWDSGNVQVRIRIGGGDKTVNVSPYTAPTAAILSSFEAKLADDRSRLGILWAAIGTLGIGALSALVWRLRTARG